MQTYKRVLALVLVLMMLVSNLPWSVMASELGAAAQTPETLPSTVSWRMYPAASLLRMAT